MNEVRTLMQQLWVCRDTERETYFQVKRDLPRCRKFIQEQLGWRLIQNEKLLKLEKVPAHAESFMGITEFQDVRDYCILCVLLIFLEDKEEQEQFLLSELVDFIGLHLKQTMEVDWNSFSQRKSLVRALQYAEREGMLKVYEGSSDHLSESIGQEVLYENTGLSRYFAVGFMKDISSYTSWQDFERLRGEEEDDGDGGQQTDTERVRSRVNRIYRQLAVCPTMYWSGNEDTDGQYLKNQRQNVERHLEENLGGRLDVHKYAAFWMLEEDDVYGMVHPREAMLPELVSLVCTEIRRETEGSVKRQESDRIIMEEEQLDRLILRCRRQWKDAWSKEYREMDENRLLQNVKRYMKDWMMLERDGSGDGSKIRILPAAGKTSGFYPKDYKVKKGADGADDDNA